MKQILKTALVLMLVLCCAVSARAAELTLGSNPKTEVSQGQTQAEYTFTPQQTGMYRFRVQPYNRAELEVRLYDSAGNQLMQDTSRDDRNDYVLTAWLEAGKGYRFVACWEETPEYLYTGLSQVDYGAAGGTCGENLTWTIDERGNMTVSGTGEMTGYHNEESIPWYAYRDAITTLTVTDGVKSIGSLAFFNCENLKTVSLPALSYIDAYAFYNCFRMEQVTMKGAFRVGVGAFTYCHGLTEITLPGTLTLEDEAFFGCEGLKTVNLPNIHTIGRDVFLDCGSLETIGIAANNPQYTVDAQGVLYTKDKTRLIRAPGAISGSYTIGYPTKAISENAFRGCQQLTAVTISASVTEVPKYAFFNCTSLKTVELPSSVTAISDYSFSYCEALTSIKIPYGVKWIRSAAFIGCKALAQVEFPTSLTKIGDNAFNACVSLTEVVIPDSVVEIQGAAFYKCVALKKVQMSQRIVTINSSAFAFCEALEAIELPDTLRMLGSEVFRECHGLTEVTIPASLDSVPSIAFYGCTNLKTVRLPETVTAIGSNAFQACFSLENINIPKNLTLIGDYAFHACVLLKELILPATVTDIWDHAFFECIGLETLVVPGDALIREAAFAYCTKLKTVRLGPGVEMVAYEPVFSDCPAVTSAGPTGSGCDLEYGWTERIPGHAFSGMTGIRNIAFPETLTTIGEGAFTSCLALTEVTLPDSVTELGAGAFGGCDALKTLKLPAGLTEIPRALAEGCEALTAVNIPAGVLRIDARAFSGCQGLAGITLPEGLETIGSEAFRGCTALLELTIPATVKQVNQEAFAGCTAMTRVQFLGDAPTIGRYIFANNQAQVFYPAEKEGWEETVKNNTIINWVPVCPGHSFGDWSVTKTAACGQEGREERTCRYCKETESRPIPALEHAYTAQVTAPGCETGGYTTYTCDLCGGSYQDAFTDPAGHSFGDWRTVEWPHCTNSGRERRNCVNCDATEERKVEKLPHAYVEIDRREADCLDGGYVEYRCSSCGVRIKTDVTEPLGHIPVVVPGIAPGCETAGATEGSECQRCGRTLVSRDWTEALGHSYEAEVIPPTCYSGGHTVFSCVRCDNKYIGDHTDLLGHAMENGRCTRCDYVEDWVAAPVITLTVRSNGKPRIQWEKVENAVKYQIWCAADGGEFALLTTVSGSAVNHNSAEVGRHYQYYVLAVKENGILSEMSNLVDGTPVTKGPELTLSNIVSSGKIRLKWTKVPGAVSYNVYRAKSKAGPFALLKNTTGTGLNNTGGITAGESYYYYVEAVLADGSVSAPSDVEKRTCDLPQPKLKLTNDPGTGKIRASWEKVPGAVKYKLYRSTDGEKWTRLTTTSGTTVLNSKNTAAGKTYYYKVVAVCEKTAGNSADSAVQKRVCDLPAPELRMDVGKKPTVAWNKISGAEKYRIYIYDMEGNLVKSTTTKATRYVHKTAKAKVWYTYAVTAIHKNADANSARSNGVIQMYR